MLMDAEVLLNEELKQTHSWICLLELIQFQAFLSQLTIQKFLSLHGFQLEEAEESGIGPSFYYVMKKMRHRREYKYLCNILVHIMKVIFIFTGAHSHQILLCCMFCSQ